MQTHQDTPSDQPVHGLIGSDKVEGTGIYRSNGQRIGRIERIMIDKLSGQTAYAVMSFGGFLGIGDDFYPIPWPVLHYDEELGGYEMDITDDVLKSAPKFERDDDWAHGDRDRETSLYSYYGAPPYW